jgi:hypothetical protein
MISELFLFGTFVSIDLEALTVDFSLRVRTFDDSVVPIDTRPKNLLENMTFQIIFLNIWIHNVALHFLGSPHFLAPRKLHQLF